MGAYDIACFVLVTLGGLIGTVAGLLGGRAEEGKDALDPAPGDDPDAKDLMEASRETLGRIAGVIARRRRAALIFSLALILLGAGAFVLARMN